MVSFSEFFQKGDRFSFRVNTLKTSIDAVIARLKDAKISGEPLFVSGAFAASITEKEKLHETGLIEDGSVYVQSLSSMLPVWCVNNWVEERISQPEDMMVLDMCAAPGSKTTQLAAAMQNKGRIVANDSSRARLFRLNDALKTYGVTNTYMNLGHGEVIWRKYGPIFDLVMLDAPCSGEGRFLENEIESYSDWSLKKVQRLAELQKKLLFSAVMCLKSGGTLVYSTCTLSPEENEAVVNAILEKFDGAITITNIEQDLQRFIPEAYSRGIVAWNGREYAKSLAEAVRILPIRGFEGFFVCIFHRS